MKQYCRYCNNLVTADIVYCKQLEKELSELYAKRPNTCKHFEFNPQDAFFENTKPYCPRQCDSRIYKKMQQKLF